MARKKINAGENLFPHKFQVYTSLSDFIEKYKDITKKGEFLKEIFYVPRQVNSIRKSGASLIFYDIVGKDEKIYFFVNKKIIKEKKALKEPMVLLEEVILLVTKEE